MYRLEFELDGLPKTTNAFARGSFWTFKKEKDKWLGAVRCMTVLRKPAKPLEKARLTLTRKSSKRPDPDGLVSSFKYVIDALVNCDILIDDTPDVIGFPDYRWSQAAMRKGSIHVIVEEVLE